MHGWGLGRCCYLLMWEGKYLLDQEENLRLKFLAIHFIWLDPSPAGQKNNSEKSLSYWSKFKVGCLGDIWTKLEVGFKFLSISISIENTFLPNLARYWQDIFRGMPATLKQKCQWWSQLISYVKISIQLLECFLRWTKTASRLYKRPLKLVFNNRLSSRIVPSAKCSVKFCMAMVTFAQHNVHVQLQTL